VKVMMKSAVFLSVSTDETPIAGLDGVPASNGLTTSYLYDDDLTDGLGIDAAYPVQFLELTTLNGSVSPFGPDATGSAMSVTNPAGETSVQVMGAAGRTLMTINPEGHTSFMQYDEMVPANNIVSPSPAITINGSLLATTAIDPNGNASTSYSDAAGRTLASKDALGNFSVVAYDANSNVVKSRDPNGLGQDCTYDALNRDTSCADLQEQAEAVTRSKTYNTASQVITSTNAEGHTTTNSYDERGRLTQTTDPNNIAVAYDYDDNNNLRCGRHPRLHLRCPRPTRHKDRPTR
jgi:YD repeat-containing protein